MGPVVEIIDLKNYEPDWKVITRIAVRGIIINKAGMLAMIKSNQYGDYKFPGGGMEAGETEQETLMREVLEESGLYVLPDTITYYGKTIERKKAIYEMNSIFEQQSKYYICSVNEEKVGTQKLDPYEERLGYHLVWVTKDAAFAHMAKIKEMLPKHQLEMMPWIYRDYLMLNDLKKQEEKVGCLGIGKEM